jgi:FkbM family methyltransferase
LNLRNLGTRALMDTPFEYCARQIFTYFFQHRAYQVDSWTQKYIKTLCRHDATCVDVGAYRGDILRMFLRYAAQGTVIGFEPNPYNFSFLNESFPDATIKQSALGARIGKTLFFRDFQRPARSHIAHAIDKQADDISLGETFEVEVTTLDDFFSDGERIDFLKIDAEGAELEILQGGIQVLSKSSPYVIIEHGYPSDDLLLERSLTLFDLLNTTFKLDVFTLDKKIEEIANGDSFLKSLQKGEDYFLAVPRPVSPALCRRYLA